MPRKLIIYNTLSADAIQAQDALFQKFQDDDDRVTLIGCTPASLIIILDKVLILESIDKVYDRLVVIGCNPTLRCCRLLDGPDGTRADLKSSVVNDVVVFDKKFVTIYDLHVDGRSAEIYQRIDHVYCSHRGQSLKECVGTSEHI